MDLFCCLKVQIVLNNFNIKKPKQKQQHPRSIMSLLPLSSDESKSTAVMLHLIHVVQYAIVHLNPGKTPFITANQPLDATLKQCQWEWPDDVGEDNFFSDGGLQIEMNIMKLICQ